uniref:Transposase n=1 Tax=Ditylenchus dipsaci TaxID=166011 RepID=A0A915DM18_9BILA
MPTVMSAIVYSSSDDASSDGGISDWNDQLEENRNLLDESGEEQSEENQVVQTIGHPKKQMAAVDPPMAVELLSSQKKMKDGRSSYLAFLKAKCSSGTVEQMQRAYRNGDASNTLRVAKKVVGVRWYLCAVAKGWKQLLTLHAKLGETFVPCLHALLPKKSRKTYDHFFSAVEHLIPNARVGHAHMDYERSFIVAERHGCFAHYAQALYRRVQKLGLVQVYKQERRFSVLFDALKSLSGSSIFIIGSAEKKFISYFEDVDLGGSYLRKINVSNKPLELLCFDCGRQIKDNEFSRGLAQLSKIGSCKFRWKEISVLEMAEKLEARMQYDGSAACLNAWNSKETEA